jgi:hypothetical protein
MDFKAALDGVPGAAAGATNAFRLIPDIDNIFANSAIDRRLADKKK